MASSGTAAFGFRLNSANLAKLVSLGNCTLMIAAISQLVGVRKMDLKKRKDSTVKDEREAFDAG